MGDRTHLPAQVDDQPRAAEPGEVPLDRALRETDPLLGEPLPETRERDMGLAPGVTAAGENLPEGKGRAVEEARELV